MIRATIPAEHSKLYVSRSYNDQSHGYGYIPFIQVFSRNGLVNPAAALADVIKKSSEVKDGTTVLITG